MAKTLTNLQTSLAGRLFEDSVLTSGTEYNRRTQFLNEGLKSILRKHYWWWTEASTTLNSVASQASYGTTDGFPSNLRGSAILELRFDGTLYTPALQTDAFSLGSSDYSGLSEKYMIFDKKLWPLPAYPSSGTANIAMKYYKISSELTTGASTIDIPDEYSDILVCFALGRIHSPQKRGSAADAYEEFNEIYKEMEVEQNNYLFALKSDEGSEVALYE